MSESSLSQNVIIIGDDNKVNQAYIDYEIRLDNGSDDLPFIVEDQHLSDFKCISEDFYTDEGIPIEDEKPDIETEQTIPNSSSCQDDPVLNEIKEIISQRKCNSRSESSAASDDSFAHVKTSSQFTSIPFGIIPKASYEHGKMCSDIMGVTYNERMRQFIVLDAKGLTTWRRDAVERRVNRVLQYPKYEYRLITYLVYAKKHNCFFGLGKDFSLKVFNRDFLETFSVSADLRSVTFMIFNPVRDELITGGVGGTMVWQFHQQPGKSFGSLRPLANYGLSVKQELPNVGGGWVKRADLDFNLGQLYCCSDTGLYVYDLEGKELLKFERAHTMTITGCRFSKNANCLVTSSVDTQVKVWSLAGGLVHTFRGHSRAVTNLMLHPHTTSIIITCSLDGSVRMWSLDTMECLYSLVVSVDGVLWMGQTDDNLLYLCTPRALTLWNINYHVEFWALARSPITHMSLCGSKTKTTRLMVISEDSSVRLMARSNRKNLTTVLPPPCISPLERVLSVCYSRDQNTIYLLVDPREIWVYTSRTDPSCRIATWSVSELQTSIIQRRAEPEAGDHPPAVRFTFNRQPIAHRATENGQSGSQPISNCCCLAVLNSTAIFWTVQGSQCTDQNSFLVLGLEDGRILFMDLVVKGQKYLELKTGKDPVLDIKHDMAHGSLNTLYKVKGMMLVQIWSLPDLELKYEVYTAPDLTAYSRLGDYIFTGYASGCVLFNHLEKAVDMGLHKARMLPEVEDILEVHHKPEHSAPIIAVDVCVSLKLLTSCSNDGAIKIWTEDQVVLTEIMLDTSLTSICFLNDFGDLCVGFQKNIFYIDHTKVCPNLNVPESDVDNFDKESIIYEDPAVMFEGIIPYPDPVTLDSYLVPFDIEFSKDFLEGKMRHEPEIEKQEASERESRASMAPTEIYFSPDCTPRRRLSLVDLTLDSEVSEKELLSYMEKTMEHLADKEKRDRRQMLFEHKREAESKMSALRRKHQMRLKRANNSKHKNTNEMGETIRLQKVKEDLKFSFPRFGKSPGPTPESSLPATPDIPLDTEEIQTMFDGRQTFQETLLEENFLPGSKNNKDEDEISKFLKADNAPKPTQVNKIEPVAPRKKFGLSGISIDAQTLMKDAKPTVKAQTVSTKPGKIVETVPAKKVEADSNTGEKKAKKERVIKKRFVDHRKHSKQKQSIDNEKMVTTEAPSTQLQAIELTELHLDIPREAFLETTSKTEAYEVPDTEEELTSEHSDEVPFKESLSPFIPPNGRPGEAAEFRFKLEVPDLPTLPPPEEKMAPAPKLSAAEAKAALMDKLNKRTTLEFPGIGKSQKVNEQVKASGAGQVREQDSVETTGQQQQKTNKTKEHDESKAAGVVNVDKTSSQSNENTKEEISNVKEKELSESQIPGLYQGGQIESTGLPRNRMNVQICVNDEEMIDHRLKSAGQLHGENLLTDSELYHLWARPKTSVDMKKPGKADYFGDVSDFQGGPKSTLFNFETELELITQLPKSGKQLQAAFEQAMMKYHSLARSGLVSDKLYKNDDQDFAENWHERQIERHMLLRMQRELRNLNVQKKRQFLEQIKLARTKEHIMMDQMKNKRIYYSHTAPVQHQRLNLEDFKPSAITTVPVPSPATTRPHTASPAYNRQTVGATKVQHQGVVLTPLPSLQQQLQQAMEYKARLHEMEVNQREKTELGHKKPFRYRLSDSNERKKQHESDMPLDFNPWHIDPRNPRAMRPKSSKSIPSKCKYYALLTKPKIDLDIPIPTPLEEQLLAERFPDQVEKVFKVYEGLLTRSPRRPSPGISYSPFEHQLYG